MVTLILFFGLFLALHLYDMFSRPTRPAFVMPDDAGLLQTKAIVEAAQDFLDLLHEDARAEVVFEYEADARARPVYFEHQNPKAPVQADFRFVGEQYGQSVWSNFPVSDVPRPGLPLGSLTNAQADAVMSMLQIVLSESGFNKIHDIMGSDQALADSGVPYAAGHGAYTLAFFGEPSMNDIWQLQFGGHHLALNIAVYKERSILAPVLTGALPASYVQNSINQRTLASENDQAFALLATLDRDKLAQAVINHSVTDLVLGPGEDGKQLVPVGIKASLLDAEQQRMLLDLIALWAGILNDVHAAPRLEEIRIGLRDTSFAWSGPETHEKGRNGASYYRIQGPNLYIEFSPQIPGGDLTMHVHSIYRDPKRAYGRTLIAESAMLSYHGDM